jgi:hypothetical protein
VHQLQSRTDEAIIWLEKGRSAIPAAPFHHSHLASAYALRGNPNAPPPNSPKPGGWPANVLFRALPN